MSVHSNHVHESRLIEEVKKEPDAVNEWSHAQNDKRASRALSPT